MGCAALSRCGRGAGSSGRTQAGAAAGPLAGAELKMSRPCMMTDDLPLVLPAAARAAARSAAALLQRPRSPRTVCCRSRPSCIPATRSESVSELETGNRSENLNTREHARARMRAACVRRACGVRRGNLAGLRRGRWIEGPSRTARRDQGGAVAAAGTERLSGLQLDGEKKGL